MWAAPIYSDHIPINAVSITPQLAAHPPQHPSSVFTNQWQRDEKTTTTPRRNGEVRFLLRKHLSVARMFICLIRSEISIHPQCLPESYTHTHTRARGVFFCSCTRVTRKRDDRALHACLHACRKDAWRWVGAGWADGWLDGWMDECVCMWYSQSTGVVHVWKGARAVYAIICVRWIRARREMFNLVEFELT